jgi:hypothetical protein
MGSDAASYDKHLLIAFSPLGWFVAARVQLRAGLGCSYAVKEPGCSYLLITFAAIALEESKTESSCSPV